MDNKITYQVNKEKILLSQLGDEGVIFDFQKNEYKILNETLFKIISGVQVGHASSEICESLVNEYNISPADCLQKVEKAIASLVKKEYILPVSK
jgi:hemoglobin-like flavoprotein